MTAEYRVGLWLKKVGSSAVFDGTTGTRVPVTLLTLEETYVVSSKTKAVHGYDAIVLGTVRSSGKLKKPQVDGLRKLGVEKDCHVFESRVDFVNGIEVGARVTVEQFCQGQFVDITGSSIGRGFAGVMKRHNFRGLKATHGVSISHRAPGSTGQCQDPGRVFKGKKMAGHMGNRKVTVQNLKVMFVDGGESLLVVHGTNVPGHDGSYVYVRDAIKKPAPAGNKGIVFPSEASLVEGV